MTRALAAVGIAALLAGCTTDPVTNIIVPPDDDGAGGADGEGGGGTGNSGGAPSAGPEDPQAYYLESVHPSLLGTCGGCHGAGQSPVFLAQSATESYALTKQYPALVTADPAVSRLIAKGEHSAGAAPALTEEQHAIVTTWLELEAAAEPTPVEAPPPALTPLQELEAFGKCISLEDWETTQVYLLANETALFQNNNVPCSSCHGNGDNGTFIDADSALMYEATRKMPWIMKFALATTGDDGSFGNVVPSNRWVEKGVEDCPIGNCHPPYTLDTALIEAINALFSATHERWEAGACTEVAEPPPEEPPPEP